jgi:hypothetical protein
MKTLKITGFHSKLIAVILCIFSVACQKNGYSPNGNYPAAKSSVNIYLVDDPSLVFDHVFLDISKVEIKVQDSIEATQESDNQREVDGNDSKGDASGGWMAVDIHPGVYDILQFRNGLDTLFASTSFAATKGLKKVRITLGTNNSVVLNGSNFPLKLNGDDNFVVIKIDESLVAVNSGGLTNFWIDIDAGQSIRKHGNEFTLKPSVKVFSKEKSGGIEGLVLPAEAAAVVMAINGIDTASAKPEAEGEFRFIGLKPGTYTLVYHATANNFIDTTVNNVTVGGKEEVKVSTVILHQ